MLWVYWQYKYVILLVRGLSLEVRIILTSKDGPRTEKFSLKKTNTLSLRQKTTAQQQQSLLNTICGV